MQKIKQWRKEKLLNDIDEMFGKRVFEYKSMDHSLRDIDNLMDKIRKDLKKLLEKI